MNDWPADEMFTLAYDELRRLAAARLANEKPGHTLDATALVHEAFLRLVDQAKPQAAWERSRFFAAAAEAMRRILVDRARARGAEKRGGGRKRLDLSDHPAVESDEQLLDLDEALERLGQRDARKAKVVELRYFAGMTLEEAAAVLGISPATADRDWAYARAWLYQELTIDENP